MTSFLILTISLLSISGVIFRPFKIPEYIWACVGAVALVLFGLLRLDLGMSGIVKGTDVYFFLVGMMLLAECAKAEGFFDWLASHAVKLANGSAVRLFFLIYLVGVLVTVFLSNDATAVVLTPAVIAATRTGKMKNPLPYLFICAFIANAASFVLPISNPANLVIYGKHLPSLLQWLSAYIIPSVVSIVMTLFVLYFLQRKKLRQPISKDIDIMGLSKGGKTTMLGIAVSAVMLLTCSLLDLALGIPTFLAGLSTLLVIFFTTNRNPFDILKNVSWQVVPLVAGLFVVVEALAQTGLTESIARWLTHQVQQDLAATVWGSGLLTALGCNMMNNLPAGLTASDVIAVSSPPEIIRRAILIGLDLGPNLSLTGSLASILWLVALRREGLEISGLKFLKLGLFVMTIPLIFAIASLFI